MTVSNVANWIASFSSRGVGGGKVWTAQFKLDRARVQQGHDTTCFSFHTHASLRVHARLVTSNLLCKALMYTLDMCTMHARMSAMHTPNQNSW